VQRRIVDPGCGEIVGIEGVAADGGVIRSDVDGASRDRHGAGEVELLPDAVSPVKVPVASRAPPLLHSVPVWVPVFVVLL
jgi:hypothetical protein